jgi:hypothetical protein
MDIPKAADWLELEVVLSTARLSLHYRLSLVI